MFFFTASGHICRHIHKVRKHSALSAIPLLLAPAALLGACGDSEAPREQVVLYYSADEHVARPVIEAFEEQSGVRVLGRGDTEATKTTGLVQRLRAERDRPRADVFWSGEIFMTIQLADEGLLAPHSSEMVADWPAQLRDEDNFWHGFAQRARVLTYNTDRVDLEEAPQNMVDMLNPRWRGRVVMARPQFGTTRGHMSALVALWGEETTRAWLEGMRVNGLRLVDGNMAVVRAVATGEADIGLTDTDDVWAGQRNDWPVDMVYIRHDLPGAEGDPQARRAGPMLIPNTVALIAGGPNPVAAQLLADFLLSPEVERMLAESDWHNIPIREELQDEYAEYRVPDPMQLDYRTIAESMDAAMRLIDETLGG